MKFYLRTLSPLGQIRTPGNTVHRGNGTHCAYTRHKVRDKVKPTSQHHMIQEQWDQESREVFPSPEHSVLPAKLTNDKKLLTFSFLITGTSKRSVELWVSKGPVMELMGYLLVSWDSASSTLTTSQPLRLVSARPLQSVNISSTPGGGTALQWMIRLYSVHLTILVCVFSVGSDIKYILKRIQHY